MRSAARSGETGFVQRVPNDLGSIMFADALVKMTSLMPGHRIQTMREVASTLRLAADLGSLFST